LLPFCARDLVFWLHGQLSAESGPSRCKSSERPLADAPCPLSHRPAPALRVCSLGSRCLPIRPEIGRTSLTRVGSHTAVSTPNQSPLEVPHSLHIPVLVARDRPAHDVTQTRRGTGAHANMPQPSRGNRCVVMWRLRRPARPVSGFGVGVVGTQPL
jgi:hypothetical protein